MSDEARDYKEKTDRILEFLKRAKVDQPLEKMYHQVQAAKQDMYEHVGKLDGLGLIFEMDSTTPVDKLEYLKEFPSDFVALSLKTENNFQAMDLGKQIRENLPEITLIQEDLLIEPYQIFASRFYGFQVLNFYVNTIPDSEMLTLFLLTRQHGMASIMNVSSKKELEKANNTPFQFVGLHEEDYFGESLTLDDICEIAEDIPEDKFILTRLKDQDTRKIEELYQAEINCLITPLPATKKSAQKILGLLEDIKS